MPTLEVRWFIPQKGFARPDTFERVAPAPARVDWYAPGNAASGVKLREGNLEVKLLLAEHGVGEFANGSCRGAVQSWDKWIYRNDVQSPPTAEALQQAGWIAVEKQRWLIKFENRGGNMVSVDVDQPGGCQVEWTEVQVAGTPWLTIGLEAAGEAATLNVSLEQTANLVLPALSEQLPLDESHSLSYPQWLEGLAKR